jgi:hypothetical protein
MNLGNVMDAVAARLDTIAGLRCFAYPPDSITPPAAIVAYPEELAFDATYDRGADTVLLPVIVAVGKVHDRGTRDLVAAYCTGSGASSIKAVVETGTYTAFDTVRVARAEFDVVRIGDTDYLAALFDLDIIGNGA